MKFPSQVLKLFVGQKENAMRRLRLPVAFAAVAFLLALGFAQPASAQTASAQTAPPLTISNNYFVTGDYVVGGVGLRGIGVNGLATGTISIPDCVQAKALGLPDCSTMPVVPNGADIVAAFLYWETVESTDPSFPPHPGQKGFFGHVNSDLSVSSYAITGTILGNPNAPTSWSSGGCSGSSQGTKTIVAYRADVRPFLPVDQMTGRIQGNGSYQVMLADSGSNGAGVPLTLGASLVIIYRVQASPSYPLNAIVLYDGAFAPSNQTNSEMTQAIEGFYQPDDGVLHEAKLTHIVGDGQTNKSESVFLGNSARMTNNLLPFQYPSFPTVAFPGIYNGSWDNVTWDVTSFVKGGKTTFDNSEMTSVTAGSGGGCVDWGVVIFSTTVQDSDGDGLLDVWEDNQGYTDVKSGQFVALPGAYKYVKDIFVEIDYLSNLDGKAGSYLHSHLPKQAALDQVGDAFKNAPVSAAAGCDSSTHVCKGVNVHFDVGNVYQSPLPGGPSTMCGTAMCDPYIVSNPPGTGGNAISESVTQCTDGTKLCEFPGTPTLAGTPTAGPPTVTWKGGFLFLQNQPLNYPDELSCETQTPPGGLPGSGPPCVRRFQAGRDQSYRYVLSGHALGAPRTFWTAFGASSPALQQNTSLAKLISINNSITPATVTIQTPPGQSPKGLLKPGDCPNPLIPACTDLNVDRVTVGGALGQPALNGTYKFTNVGPDPIHPSDPSFVTFNICAGNTTTPCTNPPGVANIAYNFPGDFSNEPHLVVTYGGPTSTSGHSDLGGGDSAVMFGLWPADDPLNANGTPNCQPDPSQPLGSFPAYCSNQVGPTTTAVAGTILHELGHTFFFTHGGTFFPNNPKNNGTSPQQVNDPPSLPSYGLNCNSAHLTSMSYLFQIRGFPDGGIDYSGQTLPSLSEKALDETKGIGSDMFGLMLPAAHLTRWYAPPNATSGSAATRHCDGTPITDGATMVRVDGSVAPGGTNSAPLDWNNDLVVPDAVTVLPQDVNFNGTTDPPASASFNNMQGFNDWVNLDLLQVSARANAAGFSGTGGGLFDPTGGGLFDPTGGGLFDPTGGGLFDPTGGGLFDPTGGGLFDPTGGGLFDPTGGEQDEDTANSTVDAPTLISAKFNKSAKAVDLRWSYGFGQVRKVFVCRMLGALTVPDSCQNPIQTLPGSPPQTTFSDTTVKLSTTYTYFLVDQIINDPGTAPPGRKSGPSNLLTVTTK